MNKSRTIAQGTTDKNNMDIVYCNEVIDMSNPLIKTYSWIFQLYELDGKLPGIDIGLTDGNNEAMYINHQYVCIPSTYWSIHPAVRNDHNFSQGNTISVIVCPNWSRLNSDEHLFGVKLCPTGFLESKVFKCSDGQFRLGIRLSNKYQKIEILSFTTEYRDLNPWTINTVKDFIIDEWNFVMKDLFDGLTDLHVILECRSNILICVAVTFMIGILMNHL